MVADFPWVYYLSRILRSLDWLHKAVLLHLYTLLLLGFIHQICVSLGSQYLVVLNRPIYWIHCLYLGVIWRLYTLIWNIVLLQKRPILAGLNYTRLN